MRHSIYRKLGVFAIAVSLLTGLFQKAEAQQANTGNYDLSLSVKSATVKTFTEAFTQKTGVLFSYEAGLAQKPMGDINIDVKGASLTSILDDVFGKQVTGFKYKLMSSTVVITADRQQVSKTGNITVSGKVTDRSGEPLIGAGVLVKGTSKGVTTDLNGNYTLETTPDAVLVYSFIGYKDQEEKVLNRSQINVSISEDANILDDVVVVGYGTQSRKSLTTSISKVDGNKLYAAPVSNIGDALKGKVTGLRVATNNTIAGNAPRFLIRGGSSISLSNDPVVIVDGVTRDMDDLNPNDIESIEVLKDAASAGIYGARASNGVILVTTKKGNSWERPRITFDAQVGWSSPSRKWDLMNAREFLSFVRPAIAQGPNGSVILNGANAAGTGNKDTDIFTTRYLDKNELVKDGWQWMYDPLDPTKVLTFTDTDWQSQWFSNALWHKEYIGVNGGSKNVKYAASVSYLQDDGMVAMSGYKLFTMHGNTSFNITKGLVASTTFDFSRSIKNPLTGNYFNAIGRGLMMSPTNREFYDDGRWATGGTNKNQQSASFYEAFYDREMAQNRFGGNFKLEWTIIDGLKATAQYAIFDDNYRGSYYAKGQVGETPNYILLQDLPQKLVHRPQKIRSRHT
jgi:TonB-linked SusC/RagA family outer membrane protein